MTVRRECGSRRCSHLSDLGSPDIGRGKKKEAKWLAGTPNGSGVPFPSGVVRKMFLSKSRGRRTIAILLRAKDKRLTETRRTPKSFKPVLKTVQSLLARERRKILQWNPVKKNKISNFGTFFLYTQILFTTLSLNLKKDKAKKRHLYSWTILLYIFDTLNVYIYIYIYITVVKNLCIFILPCGLCYYFMLSFQLLFALHHLA